MNYVAVLPEGIDGQSHLKHRPSDVPLLGK
jgi:hypothetical protein